MELISVASDQLVMSNATNQQARPEHFIRQWRKTRGMTQEALAAEIGTTTSAVSQIETYKQGYTDTTLAALAAALAVSVPELFMPPEQVISALSPYIGARRNNTVKSTADTLPLENISNSKLVDVKLLKVIGTAEAGAFRDISIIDDIPEVDLPTISVVPDPRYAHCRQYAIGLSGDSMNILFPNAEFLICAAWEDTGLALKPGMPLHIEKHSGNLQEVTVKEYSEVGDQRLLMPRSTNPAHKPIELNGDEATEIVVRGLVIGEYTTVRSEW